MKGEQLELMKVIQFPLNKTTEQMKRRDKLETAYKLLSYIVDEGHDFHIVLDIKAAEVIFDLPQEFYHKENAIITTNLEKAQGIRALYENSCFYDLKGDELE